MATVTKALDYSHSQYGQSGYIDDNQKSVNLEMTAEDLQEIENQLSKIKLHGARLDEGLLLMSED